MHLAIPSTGKRTRSGDRKGSRSSQGKGSGALLWYMWGERHIWMPDAWVDGRDWMYFDNVRCPEARSGKFTVQRWIRMGLLTIRLTLVREICGGRRQQSDRREERMFG